MQGLNQCKKENLHTTKVQYATCAKLIPVSTQAYVSLWQEMKMKLMEHKILISFPLQVIIRYKKHEITVPTVKLSLHHKPVSPFVYHFEIGFLHFIIPASSKRMKPQRGRCWNKWRSNRGRTRIPKSRLQRCTVFSSEDRHRHKQENCWKKNFHVCKFMAKQ